MITLTIILISFDNINENNIPQLKIIQVNVQWQWLVIA